MLKLLQFVSEIRKEGRLVIFLLENIYFTIEMEERYREFNKQPS